MLKTDTAKKVPYKKRLWLIPLTVIVIFIVAFFAYVSVYYHADETAQVFMVSDDEVSITETDYGWLFDGPSEAAAVIFYPGAKVEETAYAPLLHELASSGMDVCLVKMPFRLAFFDSSAAEKVMGEHEYDRWYIGGHSLGGAMAANYAAYHGDEFDGVILLAAYPTKQLPESLTEIMLVGSEDGVINWGKIEQGRTYAPSRYIEHIIEGGNHAQFGSYGEQSGDSNASITPAEQIQETVNIILNNMQ